MKKFKYIGGALVVCIAVAAFAQGVVNIRSKWSSGNLVFHYGATDILTIATTGVTADDLTVSDDATVTDDLTVTGDIAANGNLTGDGATVLTGTVANVIAATTDTALTIAQSGSIITNLGATVPIVLTLPSAATGLVYGVHVLAATTVSIDPAAADLIQGCNADGDKYAADAAGELIWLYCRGASSTPNWISMGKEGTWTDAN